MVVRHLGATRLSVSRGLGKSITYIRPVACNPVGKMFVLYISYAVFKKASIEAKARKLTRHVCVLKTQNAMTIADGSR